MIFRKEYKSIEEAVNALCCLSPHGESRYCLNCRLSAWNNDAGIGCDDYMRLYPERVAEMLGLEIVREEGD